MIHAFYVTVFFFKIYLLYIFLVAEPYFIDCGDEWMLEHLLLFWRICAAIYNRYADFFADLPLPEVVEKKRKLDFITQENCKIESIKEAPQTYRFTKVPSMAARRHIFEQMCFPNSVQIWAACFSNSCLWEAYTKEIGEVEGIDMSAINTLLEHIPSGQGEESAVTSVRLSQWLAKSKNENSPTTTVEGISESLVTGSERMLGCYDSTSQLDASPLWSVETRFQFQTTLPCHGIVIWAVSYSSLGKELSSDPRVHFETVQAIRCFDEKVFAANQTKESINVIDFSLRVSISEILTVSIF